MRHWGVGCVLALGVAGLAGCGWQAGTASSSTATGGVAVVDLDEIARATGSKTRLDDMIKMREVNLNNALGKFNTDVSDDIKGKIQEYKDLEEQAGKELSPEEAKKLRSEVMQAQAKLQQARSKAQIDLQGFTEELKLTFRKQIKPIAQEVAEKKGFSIVIPKNEGLLLSVSPANDITNDVIVALQTMAKQKPAAEAVKDVESKQAAESAKNAAKIKKTIEEKKTADASKDKVSNKATE